MREVSPPTRGWTLDVRDARCSLRLRFPRPRGDGPFFYREQDGTISGFPAHAGMDPSTAITPRS